MTNLRPAATLAAHALAAIAVGVAFAVTRGGAIAQQFSAVYLTELTLSVDNVFVFAALIAAFAVPANRQRAVLAAGVALSFIFRAGAIAVGAAALSVASGLFVALGVGLVISGLKMFRTDGDDDGEPRLVGWIKRTRLTPAVAAVIALGGCDVMFAADSIPASFGLTASPLVIVVANAAALAVLWELYFVVAAALAALRYLPYGVAVILIYVGAKLIAGAFGVSVPELIGLAVIVVSLTVAGLASATPVRTARTTTAEASMLAR